MIESPQTIQVARDGEMHRASVAWRYEQGRWVVELSLPASEPVEAHEDDAFEALCVVRDLVEPLGWRIGVAGARIDVWPSGMARDQGGGLTAYRTTAEGGVVDVFAPVDPASVTTIAEQRARNG